MLIVAGEVKVESEAEVEKARAAIVNMMEASNAEEGCILYAFSQDLADPCTIRIFEKWESQEALTAHFNAPHMAAFMGAMGEAKIVSMDTKLYDAENERPVRG